MKPTILYIDTPAKYRGIEKSTPGARICCTTSPRKLLAWALRWSQVYHADTIACRPATPEEAAIFPVRG